MSTAAPAVPDAADDAVYADARAHLAGELDRLELLLRLRVDDARRRWAGRPRADDPLAIADAEVEWLLSGEPADAPPAEAQMLRRALDARRADADARAAATERAGTPLPLRRLAALFGLSAWETDALLLCAAPELRRRYERVYAWLQDDVARRLAGADLLLELLCDGEAERWEARALLAPGAPLLRAGLLQPVLDPHAPAASGLRADPRILRFLLGHGDPDERLASVIRLHVPADEAELAALDPEPAAALRAFVRGWMRRADQPQRAALVHLHGPRGVGRLELARAACADVGCALLEVDARRLPADPDAAEALLRLAFRESLLLGAPLYLHPAEALLREGEGPGALCVALARAAGELGWLAFLAGEGPWPHAETFDAVDFHAVAVPMPGAAVREAAWRRALNGAAVDGAPVDDEVPARLAERFRLAPGQIRRAARDAARRHEGEAEAPGFGALAAACRAPSRGALAGAATKTEPRYGWDDLVLPDDRLELLREMCAQVRHARRVYEGWGFARKLPRGRGLSALFWGPPGTGKTMAAEVVAAELGLDLMKVDLARVVSKYIGETEKNLSRVFDEGEDGNAVLFFDEADALFGRRTEVSDAHDRYANLETSYLLQRMEEYAGIVVLASNLRENLDEAFLRRIRFMVEFPFPDAASRGRIWETHFPAQAPLDAEVDCALLGERLPVAGGSIRNIALHAAFLAAEDGGPIAPRHLMRSARREYEKIGKLWDEAAIHRPRRPARTG